MLEDHRRAGLPARQSALLDHALKINRRPRSTDPGDFRTLRGAGLTDREILEATYITGQIKAINTVVDGLGLQPEGE